MAELEMLFIKIINWASARNLIKGSTSAAQFLKLDSEFAETCEAIQELEQNVAMGYAFDNMKTEQDETTGKIKDGIGDVFVVLTIMAAQESLHEDMTSLLYGETYPWYGGNNNEAVLTFQRAKGNLADALLKRNADDIQSYMKTCFAQLGMLCHGKKYDLAECVAAAHDEIKDRKGIMYNGTFIKETDANYTRVLEELTGVK